MQETQKHFKLHSEFKPTGDQPQAIDKLVKGFEEGNQFQTLLGVTGSGKTFTMANIIANVNKPTLVLAHNKTLAAQLYREFKDFFPDNAVKYFVSYYDYYQPEAYIASRDLYIEKDASINDEIEMMRLDATSALMDRRDVIIVATVSCIYGLGNPDDYKDLSIRLKVGDEIERKELFLRLVEIQYSREDEVFERAKFRVRGDVIDIFPAYSKTGVRLEFWGDEIDRITRFDVMNNKELEEIKEVTIFPAKHFVTSKEALNAIIPQIKNEMEERCEWFKSQDRMLEAQRLRSKTEYDLDMLADEGLLEKEMYKNVEWGSERNVV